MTFKKKVNKQFSNYYLCYASEIFNIILQRNTSRAKKNAKLAFVMWGFLYIKKILKFFVRATVF